MVLPHRVLSFYEWLAPQLWFNSPIVVFLTVVAALVMVACFFSYLICVIRHGPFEAFYVVAQGIFNAVPDLALTSPRRVTAMAYLAVKEAIRRRVLVVFVIFTLLLLIGAWFLNNRVDDPARLYLGVVMTATNYLIVILAIFLSSFSLPADIKNRTIYTVITKPVRAGEIILGRILGFTAVGTVMLAAMCVVSYLFVTRGLDHTHELDQAKVAAVDALKRDMTPTEVDQAPSTALGGGHQHKIVRKGGALVLDRVAGHSHAIVTVGEGEAKKYLVGPYQGMLEARVPQYGEFAFMDVKSGQLETPIHVGYEWEYRMHVEGQTDAAAVWTFDDMRAERFPQGLPIELTIDVYRSYKGNIERRVRGMITLARPNSPARSAPLIFVSDEFAVQQILFPARHKVDPDVLGGAYKPDVGSDGKVDIFKEFVDENGRMEVWLQCFDAGQYFGVAEGDMYLRAADNWFLSNFVKSYVSMWMQMVLMICFGVTFSSFLSGAVAMLANILVLVIGYFAQEISDLVNKVTVGGGPLESLIRILTHRTAVLDYEGPEFILWIDSVFLWFIDKAVLMLPRFGDFNTSRFVADGFDIYNDLLAQHLAVTLAFCLVLTIVGYFFLRTREIAA
jgi:hypothetical protein